MALTKEVEFDYEIKQNSFLIDSLPVAIITFNKNFNIKKANRAAIEILGEDIINTDIRQIFRQPEILELIDKASKGDIKKHATWTALARVLLNTHEFITRN